MDLKNFNLAPLYAIVCKKIYFQDLDINNIDVNSITQSEIDRFYKTEPMHRMYIGEVIDIIDKRK